MLKDLEKKLSEFNPDIDTSGFALKEDLKVLQGKVKKAKKTAKKAEKKAKKNKDRIKDHKEEFEKLVVRVERLENEPKIEIPTNDGALDAMVKKL